MCGVCVCVCGVCVCVCVVCVCCCCITFYVFLYVAAFMSNTNFPIGINKVILYAKVHFCISIPQVFVFIWRTIYTHFHEIGLGERGRHVNKKNITLYFKVSLLQCNSTFKC